MARELRLEPLQTSRKQVALGLAAVFAVYGTMSFFVQTTNIARPKMAADLDGMSLYSWLVSIPSLAAAFATLIFGKLSDMHGRRMMLMVSLSFFLLGAILSAISPTFVILIFANSLARVGSSSVMMLSYSVLGDMFLPVERSRWVGMLNIPAGIFALVGPTLGGWFVDNLSWRHIFWISAPLLVVCLAVTPACIPAPVKKIAASLPYELKQTADEATMATLSNSRVLLSQPAMASLEQALKAGWDNGDVLFDQTVQAIENSMEAGLQTVFWIGAVAMLLSFLLICTGAVRGRTSRCCLDSGTWSKKEVLWRAQTRFLPLFFRFKKLQAHCSRPDSRL